MRRLIVVYNKQSSRFGLVEKEVLEPARGLAGFLVGKYEIMPTDLEDNIGKLAQILEDGDLVMVAGGDATALIGVNGCLNSGKKVTFTALPFGNFNDTAATLGNLCFEEVIEKIRLGKTRDFYPLEVVIDDEHFRYAMGYMTIGMFAESTKIFERRKIRKRLKNRGRRVFSYVQLAKWYLRNKNKKFLPDGKTDYMAVNGVQVGGIMRGDKWFLGDKFLFSELKLNKIFKLGGFMTRAIFGKIPGEEVMRKEIVFKNKTRVTVQTEGESKEVECKRIEIRKGKKLKAVMR